MRRYGRLSLCTALASASAVLACAGAAPEPEAAEPPGWLQTAPEGCAVGFSGPTLNPGDAIRYARQAALRQLAAVDADTRIRVESELLVGSERGGEFTRQDLEGTVRNSRIVAMWAERTSDPTSQTRVRHVYAMACHPDAAASGDLAPPFPEWLLNLPDRPGEICAIGVGGPTWDPRDQRARHPARRPEGAGGGAREPPAPGHHRYGRTQPARGLASWTRPRRPSPEPRPRGSWTRRWSDDGRIGPAEPQGRPVRARVHPAVRPAAARATPTALKRRRRLCDEFPAAASC